MPGLLPDVDPDGLLEYSVVYTDRALNHMSREFQGVMRDIGTVLRDAYGAAAVAVIPGGGSFAMEAVARQFVHGDPVLVLRHGWFSYRWSQILEAGRLTERVTVLKARQVGDGAEAPWAPVPLEDIAAAIRRERPAVVFAPHVETASGMMLPDAWLRAIGDAAHEVGALFVLDCVASGAMWVDMPACAVDVLISAPQKGWSGPACAGFVMLSPLALARLETTTSSSFAADLKKWRQIMQSYEGGSHAYHATMPTDALRQVRAAMHEALGRGLPALKSAQAELGTAVRASLASRGVASVAAAGFEAPGVVVSFTRDPEIQSARAFVAAGLQTASGVPLMCDEPQGFMTFRIGLFGLDKLDDIAGTVTRLESGLDAVGLKG